MKIEFKEKALEDIEDLEEKRKDWILEKLGELTERPTGHPRSDVIRVKGNQMFKYVMKEGRKGGRDYRAIYDIEDRKIQIKAIFHRDQGYDKEKLSERI
jgi:mRNA-degrading endonuclease RelE of RelBE toxin-antitoxin system